MTAPRSVTVTAGSRLHFGLFAFDATSGPSFGGAGMMIAEPQLQVRATRAASFTVSGPLAHRAGKIVARLVETGLLAEPPRCHLEVVAAPPEHSGLGSGTQLSLAVATAITRLENHAPRDVLELAACLNRGRRSAIGTYGFAHGGLLVDAGKPAADVIAPLAKRVEMPAAWRVVLLLPDARKGIAGDAEERAFARLPAISGETTAELREMAFSEIVPAAITEHFDRFVVFVNWFNEQSGKCFAPVQGGPYASPLAERWARRLSDLGSPAGQSSWGPTMFTFAADAAAAAAVVAAIRVDAEADGWKVVVTRPLNSGATIEVD
jgi:beta-ribofuranosylaminobenzene 5'-phosphate synthase